MRISYWVSGVHIIPEVGANHAGEFIRRYSPIGMGYGAWGVGRWRTNDVGANHASEFIRRYSPLFARRHGAWGVGRGAWGVGRGAWGVGGRMT